MLQFILLFIVLTPGILFTIPLYAKKGFGTKILTAILHGLVFVTAANFFILEGMNGEGFQGDASCGNLGRPSADGDLRIYTRDECEGTLNGIWHADGQCSKVGGSSYSYDCRYLNFPTANCKSGSGGMEGEQSTSCTECPPGTYSSNIDFAQSSRYRVTKLCTACQGNMSTSIGGRSYCNHCGTNKKANNSKTRCISCGGNEIIQSLEGEGTCTPCGTNERANNSKTRCFSCPSNKIYELAGEGTCSSCPSLTVPNSSRTWCMPCSQGKKPNDAGTRCI